MCFFFRSIFHVSLQQQAQVTVVRGDRKLVLDSMDLIPGDVISLEDQTNHNLVCDVILLRGECVVNESSLTGESVPVIKTEIPSGLVESPLFPFFFCSLILLFSNRARSL